MRNYMFDRVPELAEQVPSAPASAAPAPRLGRRGALVLGTFLAVIAALTVFTLVLYALTGDPAEYSLEGDSSGPVDPGFALPGLFEQEEETQETTIRRAQTGDGTRLSIETERGELLSAEEIYDKVLPSVVSVTAFSGNTGSAGSGVVMSADGYIITNYHVIEGMAEAWVGLLTEEATQSGIYQYPAELVGYYADLDIAVLKVDAQDLVPAEFGSSRDLAVGETAYALGNPMGYLYGTFTDGIISALNRNISVGGHQMTLIQTSAALNSGNSGGALINACGQVVGITVAKIAPEDSVTTEGLGLAIPISEARGIINSILSEGYVVTPAIGITCLVAEVDGRTGIYVQSVEETAPAAQAGLKAGDVILTVNGQSVTSVEELRDILYDTGVGGTVDVVVLRDGSEIQMSFALYANS